jgi:hypothetical protein
MESIPTAMPDTLEQTTLQLEEENNARRAKIRAMQSELALIRQARDSTFDDLLRTGSRYPNRGWDFSFAHQITERESAIEQLVYEIASLEPSPGYVALKVVSGAEFRRIYEAETAALMEATAIVID